MNKMITFSLSMVRFPGFSFGCFRICRFWCCRTEKIRLLDLFRLICKVEKILKGSLDSIPSPSPSVKIQTFVCGVKAKHCRGCQKFVDITQQCLITSSKLSRQLFEFSLKVKVMGLNPGYLLKSFLL